MPRLSKEDLLKKVNAFIGEEATDEGLSLLEDIADTIEELSDISEKDKRIQELEDRVKTIDSEWREKYRARFMDFTPSTDPEGKESEVDNGANEDTIDPPSFEDIAAEF